MKEKDTFDASIAPPAALPEGYKEYRDALSDAFETSGADPLEAQIYLDSYTFLVRRWGEQPQNAYHDALDRYEADKDDKGRKATQQNRSREMGQKILQFIRRGSS